MKKSEGMKFIVLGLVVAGFVYLGMLGGTLRRGNAPLRQQQPRPPQSSARAWPVAPPAQPPMPQPVLREAPKPVQQESAVPVESIVFGKWQGAGMSQGLQAAGICNLSLEIRPRSGNERQVSGYSTFICLPLQPLAALGRSGPNVASVLAQRMPRSAILTGTPINGGIDFTVDKLIGSIGECQLTEIEVRAFGAEKLAAEWKNGSNCPGGQLLLQKEPR